MLGDEGEHDVVDPEQGDQEQGGLGQPPKATEAGGGEKQIADAAKPRFDLDVKHAAEKLQPRSTFTSGLSARRKKKVCGEKHTSNAMRLAYEMLVVTGRKKKLPPLQISVSRCCQQEDDFADCSHFPKVMRHIAVYHVSNVRRLLTLKKETEFHSRVLVGFISSNIGAVDFLTEYSDDADEKDKVHLRRRRGEKKETSFIAFHT